MAQLKISLLGSPVVTIGEEPFHVESRKAVALLYYLAATQGRFYRDQLAALLWPEQEQTRARASLRQAIWLLRNAGLEAWLVLEHETLALQTGYRCDVHEFLAHLDAGRIAEALELYRDDFLLGFAVRDCPGFEAWQREQVDKLRQRLNDTLEKQTPLLPLILYNLPAQATPFVGREREITELETLLLNEEVRLLTICGTGGIGKTRLALEVAHRCQPHFPSGTLFVALQATPSGEFLISAIADALHLPLYGQDDPRDQLLRVLAEKELLLVLDNFEHLLDAAPLLSEMLFAAPHLKILVTSREILNLQEEWLFPVEGLTVPGTPSVATIAESEAVQLFVERAKRVRRDFVLSDEQEHVARICRLVAGMPLAIELAAVWTRSLTCAAIATRITHELAFLETTLRNIDPRHRSMHATLDHSWVLLNPKEQMIFMRLSVFRGGFSGEAAEVVTGATLPVLAALVDKSLLRRRADGRYEFHELLRQYSASHLKGRPEEAEAVLARHAEYYFAFLEERSSSIRKAQQAKAVAEIAAELENIRLAWQRLDSASNFINNLTAIRTLGAYYFYHGPYQEGVTMTEQAMARLQGEEASPDRDYALAVLATSLGWSYVRIGRFADAAAVLEIGQKLHDQVQRPLPPGPGSDPLSGRANLALTQGDYREAARLSRAALQRSEREGHPWNEEIALYLLANAVKADGDLDRANVYAWRACQVAQTIQDRWFMAYCVIELGDIATQLGAYAEAEQHFRTGYTLREELGDPQGMALATISLGYLARVQAKYGEAMELYQRGVALYRDMGDRGGLAAALDGLGATACALGDYAGAKASLVEALQIASVMSYLRLILTILIDIAVLFVQAGGIQQGREVFTFVKEHPAGDQGTRKRAADLLQDLPQVKPLVMQARTVAEETSARDWENELHEIITRVQLELSLLQPSLAQSFGTSSTPAAQASSNASLIEPLSEREIEILTLVAGGLSNQEIADRLILSIGTVKWYTGQIYGKLDVKTRTQAVVRARELQLLP